jgi:hypothetical protein
MILGVSVVEISSRRCGLAADPTRLFPATARGFSSAKEFQLPQSGQRPSHLADAYPHDWHAYVDGALVMPVIKPQKRQRPQRNLCGLWRLP